jgi:Type I phosphodiesterase / nucleotide pyrophosphatase
MARRDTAAALRKSLRSLLAALAAGTFGGLGSDFRLHNVPLRLLPLLDVCEKRDIYQPGGIPGSTSIFDLLSRRKCQYAVYSYHQGSDAKLLALIDTDLRRKQKKFYFLYLSGLDAFLHAHADQSAEAARCLDRYSRAITRLYRKAQLGYSRVRLHVFGDHGMAVTRTTVDLAARLAGLALREPRDYLCLLDSTMARFWFFSPTARAEIMSRLAGAGGRWLEYSMLRSLRAWFEDRRYGEEIYLMPEGAVIAPSHMGQRAPRGMHGFHPSTANSRAAFVSSEDYGTRLDHITDVFSVMRECCDGLQIRD